jgi:Predicted membrane protein (DUF2142)
VRNPYRRLFCFRLALGVRTRPHVAFRSAFSVKPLLALAVLKTPPMKDDESKTNWTERILILLLCLVAAVRVFIYSAGFPFFSDIDEDLHFDLITQYSHGQVPRGPEPLQDETLTWIVPYASPEFLFRPEQFPDGKFPAPLWKQTGPGVGEKIAVTRAVWSKEINFESSQPPLYYVVASIWWWIGKIIKLGGIEMLYWARFLNLSLIALVVWLGYVTARIFAPDRVDVRIGVPLLLAFIPQNVFYAMNSDVLSPVCVGVLFLCVLRWLRVETARLSLGAFTGLAIAATYLTKLSNLPFIVVAVAVVTACVVQMIRRKSRVEFGALAGLIFFAAIPIVVWMAWLNFHFGDVTGSTAKIASLDWTRKPVAEWWQHPIFTPRGVWTFWSDLIASFWRGEVKWHSQPFNWRIADGFFAISSLIFLAAAVVGLWKRARLSVFQRETIGIAILICAAGILFLALLSIQFDFGSCINPSRAHPYFTSGRLLSGALIPFGLAYVCGISYLFRRVIPVATLIVLSTILIFVTTSEVLINRVVFASEHNWFHR